MCFFVHEGQTQRVKISLELLFSLGSACYSHLGDLQSLGASLLAALSQGAGCFGFGLWSQVRQHNVTVADPQPSAVTRPLPKTGKERGKEVRFDAHVAVEKNDDSVLRRAEARIRASHGRT